MRGIAIICAGLILGAALAQAEVPDSLVVQGRIGTPNAILNGSAVLRPSGFTQPFTAQADLNGVFQFTLTGLTTSYFKDPASSLELLIGTNTITIPFRAVPFALRAAQADSLVGGATVQIVNITTLTVNNIAAASATFSGTVNVVNELRVGSGTIRLGTLGGTLGLVNVIEFTNAGGIIKALHDLKLEPELGDLWAESSAGRFRVLLNGNGLPIDPSWPFAELSSKIPAFKPLLRFGSYTTTPMIHADVGLASSGDFVVRTSGLPRVSVLQSGKVGIGTESPGQPLTVNGLVESLSGGFKFPDGSVLATAYGLDQALLQRRVSGACSTGQSIRTVNADGTVSCEAVVSGITTETDPQVDDAMGLGRVGKWDGSKIVNSALWEVGGKVGVGTPAPALTLDVEGDARFGSGAAKSTFTASGDLQVPGMVRASDFSCTDCLGPGDIGPGLGLSEVDQTVFQRRVGGACSSGQGIRTVNQDGTVTCETFVPGITAETDPKVDAMTPNQVPRWNGSKLTGGTISDVSGKVGIGTANPVAKLDVEGDAQFGSGASKSTFTAAGNLIIPGKVGVGTSNPAAKLHIAGTPGTDGILLPDGSLLTSANIGSAGSISNAGDALMQGDSDNNGFGDVRLRTGSLDRLFISAASGNVGIGWTSPLARLSVKGVGASFVTSALHIANVSDQPLLLVRDDGSVGLGTTNPQSRLHIQEGAGFAGDILTISAGASNVFRVNNTGEVRAGYMSDAATTGKGGLVPLAGLGGGFGLKLGDYRADYTFTPFGELGNAQRISLGARF